MSEDRPNKSPYTAEQAVLAGLMSQPDYWDEVCGKVRSEDFSVRQHQVIFRAIESAATQRGSTDFVSVVEALRQMEELEKIGGQAFLQEMCEAYASAINLDAYAQIVREASVLRTLAKVGMEIHNSAHKTEGRPTNELLDEAEMKVFAIKDQLVNYQSDGLVMVKHDLAPTLAYLHELAKHGGAITGISTGFSELDLMTTGMHEGDLIIIAARPAMGKTTLAMNIAESVALRSNLPVLVFSIEMPRQQIILRMLSSLSQVSQDILRSGKHDNLSRSRLQMSIAQLQKAPLYIDETSALNIADIRARVRRLKSQYDYQKLGLIIVDYIQLMQVTGRPQDSRSSMIGDISRSLKIMAKEMRVPVLALSQLSRGVDSREDKRPRLSDLRESGAIEQDADMVMFVYRDVVYNPNTEHKDSAQVIIAKQRNGPIGEVKLRFEGPYFRFCSLTGNNNSIDVSSYD